MAAVDLLELTGQRRTPYIQQSEASECGLACLAMVAGYHGLKTDMPALRRRFSLSLKGATLKAIMGIAEQIGFNARPLRGEIDNLDQLTLPAVLHWNLNHFVVLTKVTRGFKGRRYHIHDPARGQRKVGEAELSRHFTGVVLELTRTATFERRSERSLLRIGQLWSKMTGVWSSLQSVLLLSFVLQFIALAMPFYLQLAIDTVFPSFDTNLLRMLALGFAGLILISMLTTWLRSLILVSLGSSLSYQVIVNLYQHLLRLPLPWFEKRHVGDIISRFGSTRPISDLLSKGLIAGVIDGVMSLVTLGLMFVYSPLLCIIAMGALLLIVGLRVSFLRVLKARNIDVVTTAARENSLFIESIRGVAAIKAFGQETNRQRLWQQQKAAAVNAEITLGRMTAGFDASEQFIIGIERILFVLIAVSMAMDGRFTIGMVFAFQAYKQQFMDASARLTGQLINYRLLDVHLGRISDIALSQPEIASDYLNTSSRPLSGGIELSQVWFRYGVGEPEILKNIDLQIEPGSMVALVGPSGGGKTTLMKIMMGLFDPTYGQVSVDGQSLKALGLGAWRAQTGSVAQDDILFAGSIAENISFFDPEIDMERVNEVARLAHIYDDIEKMPLQFETLVGDMGSALSGGQRQRVLLARALYPNPRVLFIDEGTAHLDPQSEAAVMTSLDGLGLTRIVIAHRPQAIGTANRIILVANGRCQDVEQKEQAKLPTSP